jgi:mannose-1-phosphate guanylyltransferase
MLESMPIVILAGGLGSRLKSVLPEVPKGLAPIVDRPFLEIQIQSIRDQGATRFILCLGHYARQIQSYLGTGQALGVHIEYSLEDEGHLLGTAGALKRAERFFSPRALVMNGDTYFNIAYRQLIERHNDARSKYGALATIALARVSHHDRYGTVEVNSAQKRVIAFREKNAAITDADAWVSAGVYLIERELLDYIPPDRDCSLERVVFPELLASGAPLFAETFSDHFFDIGTPEAWNEFTRYYSSLSKAGTRGNPL